MDILQRAGLSPRDLAPDPAAPFKVKPTSDAARTKLERVRHLLAPLGPDARRPLLWAVVGAMDDAAWEAFVDATMAARRASGATWNDEPWKLWAELIEAEHARRAYVPTAADLDAETDRRASQRETLLAILRERGPNGVLNKELNKRAGFRYAARVKELRDDGYVIRTDQLAAQVFRYALEAEPGMTQRTMNEVA